MNQVVVPVAQSEVIYFVLGPLPTDKHWEWDRGYPRTPLTTLQAPRFPPPRYP